MMASEGVISVDVSLANKIGTQRDGAHISGGGDIHFRPDASSVGVKGELAFSQWSGLPIDRRVLPGGDGGADFWFWYDEVEYGIDVKIANRPYLLPVLVSRAKKMADILVLGHDLGEEIIFMGWTTKLRMLKAPVRALIVGGRESHIVPASELLPMERLLRAIKGKA